MPLYMCSHAKGFPDLMALLLISKVQAIAT